MAKNKQKAPTQPQTTKNLDLSDPRKVERFVSGEFEVSRQYLKKIRKEHPERKNVLLETEMVEPLFSRRIRAAANYLPVMMKRFEKYQNVKPDDYTVFFAQPTLSKVLASMNREVQSQRTEQFLEPYYRVCEDIELFEVGLRSLRGQTRYVAEQLFADRKKQSEVVGLDGKPLSRRTVEREKDNAIQRIADRMALYDGRRKKG